MVCIREFEANCLNMDGRGVGPGSACTGGSHVVTYYENDSYVRLTSATVTGSNLVPTFRCDRWAMDA